MMSSPIGLNRHWTGSKLAKIFFIRIRSYFDPQHDDGDTVVDDAAGYDW
jgi:hypothetical protein